MNRSNMSVKASVTFTLAVREQTHMSMDLAVWSQTEFRLPGQLPEAAAWSEVGGEWLYEGKGWQITVLASDDSPSNEVLAMLPRATHGVYVSLEPLGADKEGYRLLETVIRTLAQGNAGVWVDPYGSVNPWDDGIFQ